MAEYQPDKFIVINRKHLETANQSGTFFTTEAVKDLIESINRFFNFYCRDFKDISNHKYYICNQDEPYAQKVLDVILEGENEKELLKHQQQ